MIKHNQNGAVNGVVVSLVFAVLLLLISLGFGFWAFSSRQDYKDNSDAKSEAAVKVAVAQESTVKDKQFAEESKNPLTTYNGPGALGSLVIHYPKTWSGYVDAGNSGNNTLNAYFNPGVVPAVSQSSPFALHVQVLSQSYNESVHTLSQQKGLVLSAYALPKVPKIVGVKVTGNSMITKTDVTMIVLPLRSQTLEIETDGTSFVNDFNKYILPNFSFSP